MTKKYYIPVLVICVLVIIAVWYAATHTETNSSPAVHSVITASTSTVAYRNDQYGFTFDLPDDWRGYTIVKEQWTGYASCAQGQCPSKTGPEILIRNPKWTEQEKWQDIPILIYTHEEWSAVASGSLIVSAAPIPPQELGENANYVFALPARYNYAYPNGWQEVESIMQSHPLHAF